MSRAALCGLLALSGCLRPGEDRARLDEQVGQAEAGGVRFSVREGHATFRSLAPGEATLWAQAPTLHVDVEAAAAGPWIIRVRNALPEAALTVDPPARIEEVAEALPTVRAWRVALPEGPSALRIAAPDAEQPGPFRVAVLSDVQSALPEVGDIYEIMNRDPTIRFVISAGDLVENGARAQLGEFQQRMEALGVPLYATPGNHERGVDEGPWRALFGRGSFQFTFKGAWFTFADSSAATVDPIVYRWLKGWLARARDGVSLFLTHVPPIDPVGGRSGGWRSRREAAKLFTLLGKYRVDAAFYGHVHSLYSFSNAGVDAWISGGGGALPERLDGIGRHYLVVDLTADRLASVGVVRVD